MFSPRSSYYATKAINRATNALRQYRASIQSAQYTVVGSYHYNNVGDMALGEAVQHLLVSLNRTSRLITFSELDHRQQSDFYVVGGGANGTPKLLERLRRTATDPSDVHLLGMDFQLDLEDWDRSLLDWLVHCRSVGVRSVRQMEVLNDYFGREIAFAHVDLAFFHPALQETKGQMHSPPGSKHTRRLIINLLPYYHILDSGIFKPGHFMADWYSKRNPEFAANIDKLGPAYIESIQTIIRYFSSEGWEIVHLPFAPEDEYFAKQTLRGVKDVVFLRYSSSPSNVMAELRKSDYVVATRFHAHIFALAAGIPVLSIAYARKCIDLWNDCNISNDSQWSSNDLFRPAHELEARLKALLESDQSSHRPALTTGLSRERIDALLSNQQKRAT